MKYSKVILFVLLLLSGNTLFGQFYKQLRYAAEGGVLQSIGKETFAEVHSEVNPFGIMYTKNKRYRLPSLRLRGSIHYPLNKRWDARLQAGMNVRYMEFNLYGEYTNTLSVPITLGTEFRLMKLGSRNALLLGTGVGYNLMYIDTPPSPEKGGLTANTELTIRNNHPRNSFFYKLGYEYQQDNCYYDYDPARYGRPVVNEVAERIHFRQNRHQLFASAGLKF